MITISSMASLIAEKVNTINNGKTIETGEREENPVNTLRAASKKYKL